MFGNPWIERPTIESIYSRGWNIVAGNLYSTGLPWLMPRLNMFAISRPLWDNTATRFRCKPTKLTTNSQRLIPRNSFHMCTMSRPRRCQGSRTRCCPPSSCWWCTQVCHRRRDKWKAPWPPRVPSSVGWRTGPKLGHGTDGRDMHPDSPKRTKPMSVPLRTPHSCETLHQRSFLDNHSNHHSNSPLVSSS